MKRTTIFLVCCVSLFLLGTIGYAQAPVKVFTGSSSPTTQGWNELKLDATVNTDAAAITQTVGNGVLKLASVNAANQFSQLLWYRTNLGLNLGKGYTIEIKAKLNVAAQKGAFNIQGYDNEGKGFRVNFTESALTNQSNPLDSTTVIAALTNDDQFHVYRLAVAPSGIVTVYRDATQIGTFPLSSFQFDNIIENGGFEDEGHPDFLSNGILTRVSDPKLKRYGDYALEMNNNGLVTDGWTNIEGARTREIAVKPNTQYDISITRRRTASEPWCWRDMGAFYDTQRGTLDGVDERSSNAMWASIERDWQVHNQTITTSGDVKSIRFEFPAWFRDATKNLNTTSFDNFTFREKPTLTVAPNVTPAAFVLEPTFHDGYVNLIANGGFEDHTMNNDGTTPYTWALSNGDNNNEPNADNPMWGNNVRIQRNNKPDDFNDGDEPYAHSGTSSLRFTTMNDNAKNMDFHVELEANKTYRFSFWHRNPKWNDWGWLLVRIGEANPIWGHRMGDRANKWIPVDLVFTTTETNKTLHLYTSSVSHGGWFNQYFDDLVLYEIPAGTPLDPQIAGKTNLIANGDFEDVTKNNDGTDYTWALASTNSNPDTDFPMAYNEMWGTWLRIQDQNKLNASDVWGDRDDTGYNWAHSGTKSVRFTYEDNWDNARDFEGITGDVQPDAFRLNMNFKKELEPNKTYTFVFWIKTSVWNDQGWFHVANGDIKVLSQNLNNRYMNWSRQSVTFSTTAANHTLRLYTEFGGWMNFYLDDLFLYEEDTYVPAADLPGDSYLAFGKSTGTQSADVEVEYVKVDNTGAYAPGDEVEPEPADKTFYIDFGQDASEFGHKTFGEDANGNYWNNVIAPSGAPSTLNAGYTLPLLTSDNQPTTCVLETTKQWKSNGIANGGLLAPNPELLGDLAVATATEDYFFLETADKGAFKLKNLNPAKAYKFSVFGCRQNDAVRGGVYSITGANSAAGYLQNSGAGIGTGITNTNDNTIYESLPVIPDANGEILFEAASKDGGFVYISALKIEEISDFELPLAPAVNKKFYIDFGMNNGGLDGSPTASPDTNGNSWNNIGPAEGVNGAKTEEAGLTINGLVAADNTATSYVLTTGSTIQWNGVRTGGLTEPDPALLGDLAIPTATHDYLFIDGTQTAVLNFTALNPGKHYRFNVFGSRLATENPGNRIGILTVAGANTAYGIHQMAGTDMGGPGVNRNDRNIFVSDLVVPTTEGQITLTLSRLVGMSHINVIKLEEVAIVYAVKYNLNGGTGATDGTYTAEDAAFTLPVPTKTGYTFVGWCDNSDLTGNAITAIPQGTTGEKEFWAKWEATVYNIKYNLDGGTGVSDGTYTIESETITLPLPTKENYEFLSWHSSDRLTDGTIVTEIPQGTTGNKEFWAKWALLTGINGTDASLRIYPNPVVNGNLTIDNLLSENGKIEIYNVLGTLTGVYEITGNKTVIDISALPAGTYIVKANAKVTRILKK